MDNSVDKIKEILNSFHQEIERLRREIMELKQEKEEKEDSDKLHQVRKNIDSI